jgi:outer membrane protein assembly factor BamB
MIYSHRFPLCLLVFGVALAAPAAAVKQLWAARLPEKVEWHSLTGLGTVLVGTKGALLSFDPDTGQQMWSRTDLRNTAEFNVREVPGTPYLLTNLSSGLGGARVTLTAIDYLNGETLWQTEDTYGQYLGTYAFPEEELALFVFSGYGRGEEGGIQFRAHDLTTGEPKWQTRYAGTGAIPLHFADNSGRFQKRFDLSGYHDPVVEDGIAYLGFRGVSALDLATGEVKWTVEFRPGDHHLKRTYAPLRIDGDRIYAAGGGSVYALNKHTGAILWQTDRISAYAGLFRSRDNAIVSQLEVINGKMLIRFGGNFSNGEQVMLKEPLGVAAFAAADGAELFKFTKAKEGLTNLMILPEENLALFADAHNLYGLDVSGPEVREILEVPIEFKRQMGGGDVARLGLGVMGGVTGVVKAARATSRARLDVPVAIVPRAGHIVVMGKQHLMAYDPARRDFRWSTYYAAPGDVLGDTMLFAVTALAATAGNMQVASAPSLSSNQFSSGVSTIHTNLDRYNARAGRRFSATERGDDHAFVLTRIGEGRRQSLGLVGINLESGEGTKEIALDERQPEYRVDEPINRLFYFKGGRELIAYDL